MKLNFRSDIKQWLEKSEELHPFPTDFCPNLKTDASLPIKAVIFDIYGTLLISASGDIEEASLNTDHLRTAMEAGGFHAKNGQSSICNFLIEQLTVQIALEQETLRKLGHPHPDIDIVKVWKALFSEAQKRGLIHLSGNESYIDTIFVFELLSNRVFPMPGMKEILLAIRKKGLPMGIVSNAQFYTPIIVNYFLTGNFSTRREIEYFDPDLSVFSYEELRAKPDTTLFGRLLPTLESKYGIEAHEAVFVGNDLLKDIYTAHHSGLRTVLFAGDERSLRLRENDPRVKGLFPDFVINHLMQLNDILTQKQSL